MNANDTGVTLFEELVAMFKPHVAAVQTPKLRAWARSPYDKEEKEVLLGFWLTPMALMAFMEWRREKSLLRGIIRMIGEVYKAVFNRPRMSEKELIVAVEQWMPELTAMFIRGWINLLIREEWSGRSALDPDTLDGDMLPSRAGYVPDAIMSARGDGDYSEEEVRSVLRAVKASLPPGQHIPSQVIEILRIQRSQDLFSDPDPAGPLAVVERD